MQSLSAQCESSYFFTKYIPLYTPTVSGEKGCDFNEEVFVKRIIIVAATALLAIAATFALGTFSGTLIATILLTATVICIFDSYRSYQLWVANILKECLTSSMPLKAAVTEMLVRPHLLARYIQEKGDVNKRSLGQVLPHEGCLSILPLESVRLLVTNGYELFAPDSKGNTFVQVCFETKHVKKWVPLLIREKILIPEKLTLEQQVDMWSYVKDDTLAKWLIEAGFSPHVTDESGRTPLEVILTTDNVGIISHAERNIQLLKKFDVQLDTTFLTASREIQGKMTTLLEHFCSHPRNTRLQRVVEGGLIDELVSSPDQIRPLLRQIEQNVGREGAKRLKYQLWAAKYIPRNFIYKP